MAAQGTDGNDGMTEKQRKREVDYQNYARWAVGPLMTRAEWEAQRDRIEAQAEAGTLSSNPYEW